MILNKLKEATSQLHTEIEKNNLADLIISNAISLDQYKLLLLQNYTAYAIIETSIAQKLSDYTGNKHSRIKQDLDNLKVNTEVNGSWKNDFILKNKAEAYGAAYVVEGSALGGLLISKQIKNCPALEGISHHYFFDGNRDHVKSWNSFCKKLKEEEFTPLEEVQAIDKAKETFVFFGDIFKNLDEKFI
ncbi:hypothetical protein BH23BAC2_BH23BAC2_22000 [soil metagenome]